MRHRHVVARAETGLEEEGRLLRLRDRHSVDLDPDMARARKDVHAGVRIAGMCEDLLVLLVPCVHRVPLEPDCVTQLLEGGLLVAQRRAGSFLATGPDREGAPVTAAGRVSDAVGRQQLGTDVGGREVVGRVGRLLPDKQRTGRVCDEHAAEVGADPLCSMLDANATALRDSRWCCGTHLGSSSVRQGSIAPPSVPRRPVSELCSRSVADTGLAVLAAVVDEPEHAGAAADLERVDGDLCRQERAALRSTSERDRRGPPVS